MPDIDLNFAREVKVAAKEYLGELFGYDDVCHAGTIRTLGEKTAYKYAQNYYENRGEKKHDAFLRYIANGCIGAKNKMEMHPSGLIIVPHNMDGFGILPTQYPEDKGIDIEDVVTHFDYHDLSGCLVKLDVFEHEATTMIKMLQDMSHCDPATIPFDDPATLSLFRSTEALDVSPEDLGTTSGTLGIPEFRTHFIQQVIAETHPSCFSDLVRISGLSHGIDVWFNNAQDLIRDGVCTLHDVIATRDDIMTYLTRKDVDPLLSYETMESVRKGEKIQPDVVNKLKESGIPNWYIKSCQKIQYLYPRAHAVAYVMMSYRIAYYKVHYPASFYATYFALHAKKPDVDVIVNGPETVRKKLNELESLERIDVDQKRMMTVLQVAWEMILRGYEVSPSDAH